MKLGRKIMESGTNIKLYLQTTNRMKMVLLTAVILRSFSTAAASLDILSGIFRSIVRYNNLRLPKTSCII